MIINNKKVYPENNNNNNKKYLYSAKSITIALGRFTKYGKLVCKNIMEKKDIYILKATLKNNDNKIKTP